MIYIMKAKQDQTEGPRPKRIPVNAEMRQTIKYEQSVNKESQRRRGEFWCYRVNGGGVNGVPGERNRRQMDHEWWKRHKTQRRVSIMSVIVFSRERMAVSEDCQPKQRATYATHHHHIWRRCLRLGLKVIGQLVDERTEKGYTLVAPSQCHNMFSPEIEYLSEIEYLRGPFLAEENVSMIVKKVVVRNQ